MNQPNSVVRHRGHVAVVTLRAPSNPEGSVGMLQSAVRRLVESGSTNILLNLANALTPCPGIAAGEVREPRQADSKPGSEYFFG